MGALAEPLIFATGLVEIGLGVALAQRQPWRRLSSARICVISAV